MKRQQTARTKLTAPSEARSPYDDFAWFYNKYWATEVAADFLQATERLLLHHVRTGAHILDVCCGTGQLAATLLARGYRVTGLDVSREMLRYARRNASAATLLRADATSFQISEKADGAIALFDSFNHLLTAEQLYAALTCVHAALSPGARFVFDMNTKAGYAYHLREHHAVVKPDGVLALHGEYNSTECLARFAGTLFRLKKREWQRSDFEIIERCYERKEIERRIKRAGFAEVRVMDAVLDVGLTEHKGRIFFVAQKGDGDGRSRSESLQRV